MSTDDPSPTESPAKRILVVLNAENPEPTLQAVVEETDATTVEMDLLAVYPTAEYEVRRRARCDADVPGPYTLEQLAEEARRAGWEYFGPDPDGLDAMGAGGGTRECVRRAVHEADYSRVYVAERSRSIWQRLVGVETLSTELARLLPDVVSVEAVEDVPAPSDDPTLGWSSIPIRSPSDRANREPAVRTQVTLVRPVSRYPTTTVGVSRAGSPNPPICATRRPSGPRQSAFASSSASSIPGAWLRSTSPGSSVPRPTNCPSGVST